MSVKPPVTETPAVDKGTSPPKVQESETNPFRSKGFPPNLFSPPNCGPGG